MTIILYYIIYNIIIYLIQPLILIRLLWRSIKIPDYRKKWYERYGFYKKNIKPGGIVVHSVSIGETLASIPLIRALQHKYPNLNITLTSMTPTGIKIAQSILNNNVYYNYLPYDLPGSITRFINHTQPILVIVLETEIWPNLIKKLYKNNIPFIIANARLSLQSINNYNKIQRFITQIMQYITLIAAQYPKDGTRFLELGLKKNKLIVTGNIKFDLLIDHNTITKGQKLKKIWAHNRHIWIASSTHKGEETLLLQVHQNLLTIFPNLLMIIAPRHQERFHTVKEIIHKTGLNYITRSSGKNPSHNTQIIITDTIGELTLLYGIADIAFIGGSLIKHGGHNPIEAAVHGIPILSGPYTFNFYEIYKEMSKTQSVIQVKNTSILEIEIYKLLTNEKYHLTYGKNATHFIKNNRGALKKLISAIEDYIP